MTRRHPRRNENTPSPPPLPLAYLQLICIDAVTRRHTRRPLAGCHLIGQVERLCERLGCYEVNSHLDAATEVAHLTPSLGQRVSDVKVKAV